MPWTSLLGITTPVSGWFPHPLGPTPTFTLATLASQLPLTCNRKASHLCSVPSMGTPLVPVMSRRMALLSGLCSHITWVVKASLGGQAFSMSDNSDTSYPSIFCFIFLESPLLHQI